MSFLVSSCHVDAEINFIRGRAGGKLYFNQMALALKSQSARYLRFLERTKVVLNCKFSLEVLTD